MTQTLVIGAYFAINYVIIFITYLWYKELTRPKPMTFVEMFMYVEDVKEDLKNIILEENKDTRAEMFEQYLKTSDKIKRINNEREN